MQSPARFRGLSEDPKGGGFGWFLRPVGRFHLPKHGVFARFCPVFVLETPPEHGEYHDLRQNRRQKHGVFARFCPVFVLETPPEHGEYHDLRQNRRQKHGVFARFCPVSAVLPCQIPVKIPLIFPHLSSQVYRSVYKDNREPDKSVNFFAFSVPRLGIEPRTY
jgi:hypothetical protein